jgi:hypothetical protein
MSKWIHCDACEEASDDLHKDDRPLRGRWYRLGDKDFCSAACLSSYADGLVEKQLERERYDAAIRAAMAEPS